MVFSSYAIIHLGMNLVIDLGIKIILHSNQSFPNSHSDFLSLESQVNSNSDEGYNYVWMIRPYP